jgi:hypothetical protein
MGRSAGFSFTELDTGEYSIDVIRLALRDNPTPPDILEPSITYHGGISNFRINAGETRDIKIERADNQTSVIVKMPENPFASLNKQELTPAVYISRKVGLLLWDDGMVHGLDCGRLSRLQRNALLYTVVPNADVFTIKNLPPGAYCIFAGPSMCASGTKIEVSAG